MLADPQPLRNLRNRITSIGHLTHRIALELFTEFGFAHDCLL
ncbi:MAG: hypothetical protein RLZZ444_1862, partial [Pseudomonadota bacterium]